MSVKPFLALLLLASPAFAADAPTVTLTQEQLQRLINAEAAKSVAQFVAQEKSAAAKDVYEALEKAFTVKPSEGPKQ